MDRCPYCGSTRGVFTTFVGTQYYSWDGEEDGYSTDEQSESSFAKCVSCGRRISMKRIKKESEENKSTKK